MKIAMFTNAYPPHVGGVASSVSTNVDKLKQFGHQVLVIAPRYEPEEEKDENEEVIRLQSIKNVSGSDFSLAFPFSIELGERLGNFAPDIIHSHYPFLVGDMALRYGALRNIPVVFTHHTRYEAYDELLPLDIKGFETFVTELSTGYCNLCSRVIAPTRDMAKLLIQNGVKTPTTVIPTGVDIARFSNGNGNHFRGKYGLPQNAFVVGFTGRLAPEKNFDLWSKAVCSLLKKKPDACALLVGAGECKDDINEAFVQQKLSDRVFFTGVLQGQDLVDAYDAMDVFAFPSEKETQGLVMVEALAGGCPVVALDVSCIRNVVTDGEDGHLVKANKPESFRRALAVFANMSHRQYEKMCNNARNNAGRFNADSCVRRTIRLYSELIEDSRPGLMEITGWSGLAELAKQELGLWRNRLTALYNAINVFNRH